MTKIMPLGKVSSASKPGIELYLIIVLVYLTYWARALDNFHYREYPCQCTCICQILGQGLSGGRWNYYHDLQASNGSKIDWKQTIRHLVC